MKVKQRSTYTDAMHLAPTDGPPRPSGSTPHTGLFPDHPVLSWRAAPGESRVISTEAEPGRSQLVAVMPALDLSDPETPNHASAQLSFARGEQITTPPLLCEQWNLIEIPGDTTELAMRADAGGSGWLQLLGSAPEPHSGCDGVDLVRTTRGTHQHTDISISRGNTYPITALPHGFCSLTPLTDARTIRWLYSWHGRPSDPDPRPTLQALAITHQPSPWTADRGGFQLMGWSGSADIDPRARERHFDHADELDAPHHYRVRLEDGMVAEMTPSEHSALFRFDFTEVAEEHVGLVLDMPGAGDLRLSLLGDGRLAFMACSNPDDDPTYVYGETRQRVEVVPSTSREGLPELPGSLGRTLTRRWPDWARPAVRRHQAGTVRLLEGRVLEVVLGTSHLGTHQARHGLDLELTDVPFDEAVRRARRSWEEVLGRLEIEGGTEDQRLSLIHI